MSAPGELFKHSKLSNYSLKCQSFQFSTQIFMKSYYLKLLNNVSKALVNISIVIFINLLEIITFKTSSNIKYKHISQPKLEY